MKACSSSRSCDASTSSSDASWSSPSTSCNISYCSTNHQRDSSLPSEASAGIGKDEATPHNPSPPSVAVPHPLGPTATIYHIPSELFPEYRHLPRQWHFVTLVLVSAVVVSLDSGSDSGEQEEGRAHISTSPQGWWAYGMYWLLQPHSRFKLMLSVFLYTAVTVILQEWLLECRPSRISTHDLAARYHLPSPLSRYDNRAGAGVHWVESSSQQGDIASSTQNPQCQLPSSLSTTNPLANFDVIYLNHGFGASSLSWLPTIAALRRVLPSCPMILGHDAPGLGFTDRPKSSLAEYTFARSAEIGVSLLQLQFKEEQQQQPTPKKILLVGHSMGTVTTLHMAWQLAKNEPQIEELRLVLVAPALGLFDRLPRFLPLCDWVVGGRWWWWLLSPVLAFGLAMLQCTLRRLVGGRHYFWRNLLRWVVWGNATAVMDSDVLRYQWAAIAHHWEHGLICWALSHFLCQPSTDPSLPSSLSDRDLLRAVLQQPRVCSIDVILGVQDRIIRPGMARFYLADFANIRIVEMEGVGHDPFEENADAFVETVQRMLEQRHREVQH